MLLVNDLSVHCSVGPCTGRVQSLWDNIAAATLKTRPSLQLITSDRLRTGDRGTHNIMHRSLSPLPSMPSPVRPSWPTNSPSLILLLYILYLLFRVICITDTKQYHVVQLCTCQNSSSYLWKYLLAKGTARVHTNTFQTQGKHNLKNEGVSCEKDTVHDNSAKFVATLFEHFDG